MIIFKFTISKITQAESQIDLRTEEKGIFNSIPLLARSDATFVRESIDILYKNEREKLPLRSLSGGAKRKRSEVDGGGKQAITPTKRTKLVSLFENRLAHATILPADKINRLNKLNTLISNGLLYLAKSTET